MAQARRQDQLGAGANWNFDFQLLLTWTPVHPHWSFRCTGLPVDVGQASVIGSNPEPGAAGFDDAHSQQGIVHPEQRHGAPAVRPGLVPWLRRVCLTILEMEIFPADPVLGKRAANRPLQPAIDTVARVPGQVG